MKLPTNNSQELQKLCLEHWAVLPNLPPLSGPTIPTIGRRFYKHSPTTILKLGTDHSEGIMTALAYSILGPCVPRVISIVTVPTIISGVTVPSRTNQGLVLTHQPGTPLVELWPILTLGQREFVKSELCRLLVRMRLNCFSYYGRPTQQPYVLLSEFGTEVFAFCASRLEWDNSRVKALREHAPDVQLAVELERVQRGTIGAGGWDRPVLTHGDLSDRNILVDPDTLMVTGFLDWETANIMPAYFEYVAARLSGGHKPAWRKELLDVLRSVLRCECKTMRWGDIGANDSNGGRDNYSDTLAAWDAIVNVERIAQGYDSNCKWTFIIPKKTGN